MLLQMAAYLSAKDETITALQQQVKAEQDKRKTQESIRNYEDTGRSSFQFHPDDIADLMHTFVIPHIRELDDQKYYSDLDMATALPEDLSRGISMVTNLPKSVKNPIFQRNLRSNQLSTLPRECSDLESKYYSVEQKSKDDALVKLHKDFAPVLQVLLHTSLQTLQEPDDTVSAETLLSDVQNSAFDLCQILFEFFGKTIVQPRREIFQKATGLSVSHNTSSGFLTRAESEAAMATARQHDLIGTHIDAVRPNSAFGRGRGKGKNGRRGAQRPAGRGHGQLRQLQSVRSRGCGAAKITEMRRRTIECVNCIPKYLAARSAAGSATAVGRLRTAQGQERRTTTVPTEMVGRGGNPQPMQRPGVGEGGTGPVASGSWGGAARRVPGSACHARCAIGGGETLR